MDQTSIVGVAVDYAQLRKLIAARRQELGLRQLEVDDLAGLQGGYTGKLECGDRHFGDMSMGSVLGALGLELVAVRSAGPNAAQASENARRSQDLLREKRRRLAAKGGRAAMRKMTPLQRKKFSVRGQIANQRRWREKKAAERRKALTAKAPAD